MGNSPLPLYQDTNMYKDIIEQPTVSQKILETYLPLNQSVKKALELSFPPSFIASLQKILIIASGSSYNAGKTAQYFFEAITHLPTEVRYSSECLTGELSSDPHCLIIGISQSGETTDTRTVLEKIAHQNQTVVVLTNNPQSLMHQLTDFALYILAGEEKSIAATKSFTAQLLSLYSLALFLAEERRSLPLQELSIIKQELQELPLVLQKTIDQAEQLNTICEKLTKFPNLIFLGRGAQWGIAQEGALKIKETCYIHTSAYPTGEFLHGHLAMVAPDTPIISIITKTCDNTYELALQNTLKIQTERSPWLHIIKNFNDEKIHKVSGLSPVGFLTIPTDNPWLTPFSTALLLQLTSLKTAILLNYPVDSPRSLKKIVQ